MLIWMIIGVANWDVVIESLTAMGFYLLSYYHSCLKSMILHSFFYGVHIDYDIIGEMEERENSAPWGWI